ncbi:MAG: YIP1 family protein [Clostridia bacterium]|nr:YIP1 family protein [Clostridia bacterium]
MKKALSRLFAVILAIVLAAGAVSAVSATTANDSYTYWKNIGTKRKAVYSKPMYDVGEVIDVTTLGIARLTGITSMCRDNKNNLYILDSNSRIVVLDNNYNLVREIGLIDETISYEGAKGIYFNDGKLYVCNTTGGNILIIDSEGKLLDTIEKPTSDKANLIPDDFLFEPTRIARDNNGFMYVLCSTSRYGALLYSPEREFLGFYGANTVKTTVASVLTNISNRLFPNPEKHANKIKEFADPFVDITVDDEGFVYTCNPWLSNYTANSKGQIRRLSPGFAKNLLDGDANYRDEEIAWSIYNPAPTLSKQDLCDIEVDKNGFIYALESMYDKVFLFDPDSNMITTFGGGIGKATQKGTFTEACAMVLKNDGEKVLIADASSGNITEFKINEFGKNVKKLDYLTKEGHYDQVKAGWEEVLSQDANCQVAYSGIANAYLEEKNYDMALHYAKLGYDKKTYGVAFEYVRTNFISDNFAWIFAVLVVVILGAIAFMFVTNKKKVVLIKNKSLNLMLTTMIHPSNNFTDIKEKGLGSVPLSLLLIVLYYVVTVLKTIAGGFLFTNYDPANFNSIIVLIRSVGLVVLWIISNWLVCTLLGGKGKLKEILIVTSYSLLPLILEGVINIILSNVLLPVEASFLSILSALGFIYFAFMLVIGMLKIHDYSMGKFIWTTILSVAGIAIIIFLMIMLVILLQQFGGFLVTIATEILSI